MEVGTPAQFRTCKARYLARSVGLPKRRYADIYSRMLFRYMIPTRHDFVSIACDHIDTYVHTSRNEYMYIPTGYKPYDKNDQRNIALVR